MAEAAKGATALVVIDVQNSVIAEKTSGPELDAVLGRMNTLIDKARAAKIPVFYVQHETVDWEGLKHGSEGWQIHPAVAPKDGEPRVYKQGNDAFYKTSLRHELDARGVTNLVVCGCDTDACVDTTVRRAISLEYDVLLAGDAHTTSAGGDLTVDQIIAHTNMALGWIQVPGHGCVVKPVAEIEF